MSILNGRSDLCSYDTITQLLLRKESIEIILRFFFVFLISAFTSCKQLSKQRLSCASFCSGSC